MPAPMDTDQCDLAGIYSLQVFAVADRDQPVAGAMYNIGMAFYFQDPFIGAQVIAQYNADRQDRQEALDHFTETKIGRVKDKITGVVIRGQLGGKATAHTAAVKDQVVFGIFFFQPGIDHLHIVEHFFFTATARAFSKAAIVEQHYVVIVTIKIAGIPGPAFNAACISMKI